MNILSGAFFRDELNLGVPYEPRPGYIVKPCKSCQEGIWVGPKQQTMLEQKTGILLCMRCIMTSAEDTGFGYLGGSADEPEVRTIT